MEMYRNRLASSYTMCVDQRSCLELVDIMKNLGPFREGSAALALVEDLLCGFAGGPGGV